MPKAVSYNAECLTAGLTLTAEPVAVQFGLEILTGILDYSSAYGGLKKCDGIIKKRIRELALKVAAGNGSKV